MYWMLTATTSSLSLLTHSPTYCPTPHSPILTHSPRHPPKSSHHRKLPSPQVDFPVWDEQDVIEELTLNVRAWLFCRRLAHISPGRRWRFKSQGLHVHNINEHYSNRSRTMPKLFKDPGGTICLPPAVQSRVVSWKRPTEITADPEPPPWVMVSPKRFETVPQFHIQSESEKTFLRAKKMRVKPKLLVSRLHTRGSPAYHTLTLHTGGALRLHRPQ